jgi:CRISPR-associated protein Cmr6
MTPHFVDYYNSLTSHHIVPPSDDQTPNPIAFLTVDVGNLFWFGIIPRHIPPHSEAKNPCPYPTQDLLIAAGTWLQGALIELGGGGKTSAGYGYFQPFV